MNYIGSKFSILDYIDDTINDFVNPKIKNIVLCDIFSGTGVVGKFFKKKGYNVISNDIQFYSYIMSKHFIENNNEIKFERLGFDPFDFLNNLSGVPGFIYNNYSLGGTSGKKFERQYFSDLNAMKIDAIRITIENWKKNCLILDNEYVFLIACLIEAADKVANTASVYGSFLKKFKRTACKPLVLLPIDVVVNNDCSSLKSYNCDANDLIKIIKGDILYLDPPYNKRKYDSNYHLLETIALYDEPCIFGKTGIRNEKIKKSKYCSKLRAARAFEDLIKNANFKYILLSYNDEGIISIDEIKRIMSKYGKYKCYEKKHKRLKTNNVDSSKAYTIEYIHCLERNI